MEAWVPVDYFERYSVSDEGRVRNDETGRIMAIRRNGHGVYYVGLMHGSGMQKIRSLPLLVATGFIPQPAGCPTPIHLDGDRGNNRADNLAWRPFWFAKRYHEQFKRPYPELSNPIINLDTGEKEENMWSACLKHGLLESDLHLAIMNRTFVYPTYQRYAFVD